MERDLHESLRVHLDDDALAVPPLPAVAQRVVAARDCRSNASPSTVLRRWRWRSPTARRFVADPEGERLLGVHIVGECATELIHVGQMAISGGIRVDDLIENVFNFPTLSEAYRIAALEIANHSSQKPDGGDR